MNSENHYSFYKLGDLLEHLRSGELILTPNQRLARRIKSSWAAHLQEQGETAWETPRVMSIESWWAECYQAALLAGQVLPNLPSQQQELELWQRCIEADPETGVLLRPRAAAQLARDAYNNLLLWQLDWRREPHTQQFRISADAGLFVGWATQFEIELAQRQLSTLPALIPQLAQYAMQNTIVAAEFDELPPLYRQQLQRQTENLLDYRFTAEPVEGLLQVCESPEDELHSAARWAKSLLMQNPGARIGILVPNLQTCRYTVERAMCSELAAADEQSHYNISGGVALDACPPVRTALELLLLIQAETRLPDLVRLLHSRYRDRSEFSQELVLLANLYRLGVEKVDAARLRQECARIKPVGTDAQADTEEADGEGGLRLGRQLLQLSQQRELRRRALPSQWIELFMNCLTTLGWPGDGALDSLEYQQVEHWYQALDKIRELDQVCGQVDFFTALQKLRSYCASEVFQPQTADAPVQVLGLLEGAGLHFSHLWLVGMTSSAWPSSPRPNPFIPISLQRDLQMPHASAERELQYAGALLHHYRQACTELVVSYSRMAEGIPQQPSPLLTRFVTSAESVATAVWPPHWESQQQQAIREHLQDEWVPLDAAERLLPLRGGSGLIADQSQCPFRAFAHHRLGARALPEIGVALSDADRGGVLHDALFNLWGQLQSSRTLASLSEQERITAIDSAIREALTELRRRKHFTIAEPLVAIESQRLQVLLTRWLHLESARDDFEVLAREQDCKFEVAGLQLNLRIDRIDLLANGRQLIIDYKSGAGQIRQWLGERPDKPQLPMYACAMGDDVEGVAFAVLNQKNFGFLGLTQTEVAPGLRFDIEKATKLAGWEELQTHWESALQQLAEDYVAGRASVDPMDPPRSCTYCKLESLCRIA